MKRRSWIIPIFVVLAAALLPSCHTCQSASTDSEVKEGAVWSWGSDRYAALGRGEASARVSRATPFLPGPVAYRGEAQAVATGWRHGLVLGKDGYVVAWGENKYGQIGVGNTVSVTRTPMRVRNLRDVVALAAGSYHSVAVMGDGTVWTWGSNGHGELGDGSRTNSFTPVCVRNVTRVKATAAGDGFTAVLRKDGTVWTWGDNTYGQLGDGTTDGKTVPVQVVGLTDVTSIACGRFRTTALKADGSVWNWGFNSYGQLGDGSEVNQSIPVKVLNLGRITSLSCGEGQTLALDDKGKVWVWGAGYRGELGIGEFNRQISVPQEVVDLPAVRAVCAAMDFSIALAEDGSVWGWGRNWYGQLGMTSPKQSASPIKLSGLSGIKEIACATHHGIAILAVPREGPK